MASPLDRHLLDPHIRLFGRVDRTMFESFVEQLNQARRLPQDETIVLELTTAGGEADTGRRIAADIALCRRAERRPFLFLGKTSVFSAGVTIMAAFPPKDRFLTEGTELLVHERRVQKSVQLPGGLHCDRRMLMDEIAEIESGERLERAGFEQLVAGTRLGIDRLLERVRRQDWYLPAQEALELGLVARLVPVFYGTD